MRVLRHTIFLGLALAALLTAGCTSSENDETPSVCLTEPADYRAALQSAPDEVRLEGGAPISDCLVPEQSGGELAGVGESMVEAATTLNAQASENPSGDATVQLGYLVGAVERGSEGIHADLVRRLNSAARFSPGGLLPPEFERTFGKGYAAGRESG